MSGTGILFMVLICSVIWGGFLLLLVWMMKSEKGKARSLGDRSHIE
jgi:putative copper export protein